MNKPKILLFDIETQAGLGWFWEQYETNILAVKEPWYIISFAYKWLGEKETYVYALPDFKGYRKNKKNDKELCRKLWELLNSADVVIAHYGDAFDLKKANARFIHHGFKPVCPSVSIDTKKVASKHFKFGSNKLNALAGYFGIGQKEVTTGFQLWLDCAEHDKKEAWAHMKKWMLFFLKKFT
jgi:DNA polymerase elongation subunit (family B)